MIKDVVDNIDRTFFESDVSLTVSYKKESLFSDECFIDEPLHARDLGIHFIHDCNENEGLKQLQEMMMGHLETCLSMDF